MTARRVLAINAGSSSLKVALFAVEGASENCLLRKKVENVDRHAEALATVLPEVGPVDVVGHRLVHGGPEHVGPARVDAALRRALDGLIPLAPLHLPAELALLDAVGQRLPGVPQVVCFDTAFHRTLSPAARHFGIPERFHRQGIRRYGFHGLSYQYVVETVGKHRLGRAVICHLGSGASMAAIRDGASIDTTMGLTPTGGFVMGTRSGDLDPGVVLRLLAELGGDAGALDRLLSTQSGLLGMSGTSSDMKALLGASATDAQAALAVDVFCHQARKSIAALAAVLGGIDTLVFTGGIGEHSPVVRQRLCEGLSFLGLRLDEGRNQRGAEELAMDGSACRVLRVATDEERMIARESAALIRAGAR